MPAPVSAGLREEVLPAAAQAAECLPVVLGVEVGEFLEHPVNLEAVPGVHDEGRLVGRCIKQGQGRTLWAPELW